MAVMWNPFEDIPTAPVCFHCGVSHRWALGPFRYVELNNTFHPLHTKCQEQILREHIGAQLARELETEQRAGAQDFKEPA